jgi:hypothetical protein
MYFDLYSETFDDGYLRCFGNCSVAECDTYLVAAGGRGNTWEPS